MNILMIGVGYVGLVSGTCFSAMGHRVTCLDIDQDKINKLKQGIIPIYEPGLKELIENNVKDRRLNFTTDYKSSVLNADVCFIAVDTPSTPNGSSDTSQIENVAHTLGKYLQHYCIIITKSTVPIGTTFRIAEIIRHGLQHRKLNIDFDVVANPEFLKEGNAVQDFMKPDRIVIGIEKDKHHVAETMKKIYSPFMLNHDRLIIMDILSAELAKYVANAMLATRISFMNEIANLCEKVGADVDWIRKAIGSDDRIGNKFLYPGPGFGGSCLPKDLRALLAKAKEVGSELSVLQAVQNVNQQQKNLMSVKIQSYFQEKAGLSGKTIGILGLSFKPDTDDMREAASLVLIEDLIKQNVRLRLFDPAAMAKAKKLISHPSVTWCQNEIEAAEGADALVLMTEWKQFRFLDFGMILQRMKGCAFFDGRNQYRAEEMASRGFDYISIGRKSVQANQEHVMTIPLESQVGSMR